MSAFLGQIHYWLYNKILWHENLLNQILDFAVSKNIDTNKIKNEIYDKYGAPDPRPLEEIIDHQNIHGWLQSRIISVETRIAWVITNLIKNNISIENIAPIYRKNGESAAQYIDADINSPQDFFNLIFDFLLSGMPCDRVNEVVEATDDHLIWINVGCIHKNNWDIVQGNVENYYILQDAWIEGFVTSKHPNYSYSHENDQMIIRKR